MNARNAIADDKSTIAVVPETAMGLAVDEAVTEKDNAGTTAWFVDRVN